MLAVGQTSRHCCAMIPVFSFVGATISVCELFHALSFLFLVLCVCVNVLNGIYFQSFGFLFCVLQNEDFTCNSYALLLCYCDKDLTLF